MRIIIISTLILINSLAFSQTTIPVDENKKFSYEGVVDLPGKSKVDLFNKSKEFFYSKNPSAIVQTVNGEVDKVFFNGCYAARRNNLKKKEDLNYTITLFVKDGKVKYQMTNFVFYGLSNADEANLYGNGSTYGSAGNTYHYNLEKYISRTYDENSILTPIDKNNRIIIGELVKYLSEEKKDSGF